MKTLAERLQAALDRNPALSQAGLARACGIASASVSNWFTGETKTLRAKNLRAAANYLGCNRDWLETGHGLPVWKDYQPSLRAGDAGKACQAVADDERAGLQISTGPQTDGLAGKGRDGGEFGSSD